MSEFYANLKDVVDNIYSHHFTPLLQPNAPFGQLQAAIVASGVPNYLNKADDWVSTNLPIPGVPLDQKRFIFCMLSSIVLSVLHRAVLPSSRGLLFVKHLFTAAVSLFFLSWCFRGEIFLFLIQAFGGYLTLHFNPFVKSARTRANLCFLWSLSFMSCVHIKNILYRYGAWDMDISGPLMVLTQKLSMYGYNVADGNALNEMKQNPEMTDDEKKKVKKSLCREEMAICEIPSFLEFWAYMLYHPGILAGPSFEYKIYASATDLTLYKKDKKDYRPSTLSLFFSAMKRLLFSFVCIGGFIYMDGAFPKDALFVEGSEYSALSPSYTKLNFFLKLMYISRIATYSRLKYYFAWLLAESSVVAMGYSYNGVDKNGRYKTDLIKSQNIEHCEFAQSPRELFNNWNMGTNSWLRYYVYVPASPVVGAGLAKIWSFMVSAFWHGFYGGYYLTFFFGGILNECGSQMRKTFRPLFGTQSGVDKRGRPKYVTGIVYNFLGWFGTMTMVNYLAIPFIFLRVTAGLTIFNDTYWIPHILLLVCLIGCPIIRGLTSTKKKKKQA